MLLGCRVQDVSFGEDLHEVSFTQMDTDVSTNARWLVDAAGRASLLKRKLGLAKDVGHTINSAWFRLAGGLDIEDFGRDNEEWMGRMSEPGIRQYSTNHLLGRVTGSGSSRSPPGRSASGCAPTPGSIRSRRSASSTGWSTG